MSLYIKVSDECDYCGELARREKRTETPDTWNDGMPIKPHKNKTRGIICADCQWNNFEEFCHSQGVSPHNPVKYFS